MMVRATALLLPVFFISTFTSASTLRGSHPAKMLRKNAFSEAVSFTSSVLTSMSNSPIDIPGKNVKTRTEAKNARDSANATAERVLHIFGRIPYLISGGRALSL
jgi:hypothetical protein